MAAEPINLRCSALPLAFRCPGSLQPTKIRINPHHPAADLGKAQHEACQPLVEGRALPWDRMGEIAAKHGVPEQDLRALCGAAQKLWGEVRDSFPAALSEAHVSAEVLPGVVLDGHLDGVSFAPNAGRGLDWKGSRKDPNYAEQLRGYAALLLIHMSGIDEATLTALWLRTREVENYTMTRSELERWKSELRDRVVEWNGVYHPGEHCQYCPRSHARECEAALEYQRAAVAIVADRNELGRVECDLASYTPDQLIQLKKKCSMVTAYAERVTGAIAEHVKKHGDLVGSKERITVETSHERTLDPIVAWPILEGLGFTEEDMAKVITMSAKKIDDRVSAKTPRGEKGRAIKAASELLERSGALTKTEVQRLTIRRI